MSSNGFAGRYFESSVNTSSPTKLVVLLYEGAIRFIRQAVTDIEEKNYQGKRVSVDRAMAIVQQLHGSLDMVRGGAIAADLDRLYNYVTSRILEGSANLDTRPLSEAVRILTALNSAWTQIASRDLPQDALQPASHAKPANIQVIRA